MRFLTRLDRGTLFGFALVLLGLTARALLDKILAHRAGPAQVAHWAQLQSVVELVAGVTLAGIGQGLTVYAARYPDGHDGLLKEALAWGVGISGTMTLLFCTLLPWINPGLAREVVPGVALGMGAAWAGGLSVVPGLFIAYWQGRRWRGRMLLLTLASWLPLLLGVAGLFGPLDLQHLLGVQAATQALLAIGLCLAHRRCLVAEEAWRPSRLHRYLLAGLSIGLLSPASLLWSRAQLAQSLSWNEVAQLQALWRASEWVTGLAASVLFLVFLPRLAVVGQGAALRGELARIWRRVWLPVGLCLLLLWGMQGDFLRLLYDDRFVMPPAVSALFLLGDALRVAAWVPLLALFARERIRPVALGEWLSLPLFATLLTGVAGDSLALAGICYVLTYAIYLGFNLICVYRGLLDTRWD